MRTYWYLLGILVGLTVATRGCGHKPTVERLALSETWDPNTRGFLHVAAWRRGDTIFVQTSGRTPVAVYSDPNLAGEPEIEEVSAAMYAITSRAAGGWHDEVLIHLDKDGTPRGSVFTFRHAVAAEQHCSARQEVSPGITGIIGRHRSGGYAVQLTRYDSWGDVSDKTIIRTKTRPHQCTIATENNELGLAIRFSDRITLQTFHASLAPSGTPFEIPTSPGPGHVSMTTWGPIGHHYAVLHHGDDGHFHATMFTSTGVTDSLVLPDDVDPASADISHNDRGTYVTWIHGTTLHTRGLARSAPDHRIWVPRAALTRTDGLWDHCTTAVYSPRANRVTFTRIDDCP